MPEEKSARDKSPLAESELQLMNEWWHAANYLSVGQVYLLANPLLREPLRMEHVKPRLLGHWGTVPGLNFIWVHLNRIIRARDLNILYIAGPGHGAPGVVANTYLEGTYSELYPDVSQDVEGMTKLVRQFSFPGGIPSHAAPQTPGSIHEGGELGYSLAHAFGAVLDNPDLITACVVGDGEAETGPLATSWHCNKFLNPATDGAVLPILHLNGYKIANPTVLARIEPEELDHLLRGYGYAPHYVEGDDPLVMHQRMANVMDEVFDQIRAIQQRARDGGDISRPRWPMIVLRSPKGWTGPKTVDGLKTEGFWRAHQVPFTMENPKHLALLDEWLKSYKPDVLFTKEGKLRDDIAALSPKGTRRMSANPHANGGLLKKPLKLPDFRDYAVDASKPGRLEASATKTVGTFLRDVMKMSEATRNFRIMGPDETASNRSAGRVRSDRPRLGRGNHPRGCASGAERPRDGDPQRACLRGLARRVSADRAAWHFQLLRGVHPHYRFDVQPARQVAEDQPGSRMAPPNRLIELHSVLPCVAAGP